MIVVDGTPIEMRFLVIVDNEPIPMTYSMFRILIKLAVANVAGQGWIDHKELDPKNGHRYIYRFRAETEDKIPIPFPDKGRYRIDVDPGEISFNFDKLKEFPDRESQEALSLLRSSL